MRNLSQKIKKAEGIIRDLEPSPCSNSINKTNFDFLLELLTYLKKYVTPKGLCKECKHTDNRTGINKPCYDKCKHYKEDYFTPKKKEPAELEFPNIVEPSWDIKSQYSLRTHDDDDEEV